MICKATCSVVKMDNGFRANLSVKRLRRERKDRGILYRAIRELRGLSQSECAKLMGITKDALVRREHVKRLYNVIELVELQRISGLNDTDWCELLRQIAK